MIKMLKHQIELNRGRLVYNDRIYHMLEGDLLDEIHSSLKRQFRSERSITTCMERAVPINVWKKVVDKISTLYINEPLRTTQESVNQGLIDYYAKNGVNAAMSKLNSFMNAYRWAAMEIRPTIDEITGRSKLSFNTLLPVSYMPIVDPLNRTHVYGFAFLDPDNENFVHYYTSGLYFYINLKDEVIVDQRDSDFNFDPFIYASDSDVDAFPKINQSTLRMPVLISILLSDINYGMLYNFHPIIYTVNTNEVEFARSPETWLDLKSDSMDGEKASIGVLNTAPDVTNYVQLVRDEMALWLDSEGLKSTAAAANSNGAMSASGISKIIDNADISEKRKKQEIQFSEIEQKLWKKIAYYHNQQVENGELEMDKFVNVDEMEITIDFNADSLLSNDSVHVATIVNKYTNGLISRRQAIKEINPTWSDEKIDEQEKEIDAIKRDDNGNVDNNDGEGVNEFKNLQNN